MAARLSPTARVGLALILAPMAWLGGWAGWNYTRNWTPLDLPISFSRGHIRKKFKVNIESDYTIALGIDSRFERVPCSSGSAYCVSLVRAPWSLSKDGRIVATGVGEPEPELNVFWSTTSLHTLGNLHLNPGSYVLDLDVRDDQSRLNFLRPSFVVYESGGKFIDSTAQGAYAFLTLLLMVPVGICTVTRSALVRRQENWDAFIRSSSLTQPGVLPGASLLIDLRRKPRRAMPSPFSKTGNLGLNRAMTYLAQFLIIPLLVMIAIVATRYLISGLPVHLLRPGVKSLPSPGIQPLRIHVAADGLVLDSKLIRSDAFGVVLRAELNRRPPDWPVYLEGDRDLEFSTVAHAIDAIRAARAEVVLLTPGYKAALGESDPRRATPTHGTTAK
jgi:biopolymer transport protein ExbD